jgi:hypothetical protein
MKGGQSVPQDGYSTFHNDIRRRKMPPAPIFLKPILRTTTSSTTTNNNMDNNNGDFDDGRRDLNNPYRRAPASRPDSSSSPSHTNIFKYSSSNVQLKQSHHLRSSNRTSNSQRRLDSLTGFGFEEYLNSVKKGGKSNYNDNTSINYSPILRKSYLDDKIYSRSMVIDGGTSNSISLPIGASNSISFPTDQNSRLKALQSKSKSLILSSEKCHKKHQNLDVLPRNLLARKYALNDQTKFSKLRSPVADRNHTSVVLTDDKFPSSSSSPSSSRSSSSTILNQQWSKNYIKDTEFFTSRALWTEMKISEASSMDKGTLAPYAGNFLTAVTSHLLIAEEPLMLKWMKDTPGQLLLKKCISNILKGIFCDSIKVSSLANHYRVISNTSTLTSSSVPSIQTPQNLESYTAPLISTHQKNTKQVNYRSPTPKLMKSKKISIQYENIRAKLIENLIPLKTFSDKSKKLSTKTNWKNF